MSSLAGAARGDVAVPARLEYSAPPSCPTEAELAASVGARTPRVRLARDGAGRAFRVDVIFGAGGYVGRLSSVDASGVRAERDVTGESCAEVVDALALVLALAVDPMASASPRPAPAETPSPAASAPTRDAPTPAAPSPSRTSPFSIAAGIGVGAVHGVGPDPLLSVGGFVEGGLRGATAWQPTVRLGAERAASGTFDVPASGSASFTWTVATLDLCPVRFSTAALGFSPCLRSDLGALAGTGSNIASPRADARAWADVGLIGRGEWSPMPPVFLDVEAGGLVALTRPRFHFDVPDVTVHQPSAFGAIVAVHAGGRFP